MASGTVQIDSLAALRAFVSQWAGELKSPAVIALYGPMGAGKTQLTQFLAAELGCEQASSPTFAIHHRYRGGRLSLDHVDLYRIESEEELEGVGFWDLFSEPTLLVVEWAGKVPETSWPLDWELWRLSFTLTEEGRSLRVEKLRSFLTRS